MFIKGHTFNAFLNLKMVTISEKTTLQALLLLCAHCACPALLQMSKIFEFSVLWWGIKSNDCNQLYLLRLLLPKPVFVTGKINTNWFKHGRTGLENRSWICFGHDTLVGTHLFFICDILIFNQFKQVPIFADSLFSVNKYQTDTNTDFYRNANFSYYGQNNRKIVIVIGNWDVCNRIWCSSCF